VTQAHADGEVDMDRHIAAVTARLNERVAEMSSAISTALEENIAELPRDGGMRELLHLGVKDHLQTILHALLHDMGVEKVTAPATALAYARGVAQHSVPANAMMRASKFSSRRGRSIVRLRGGSLGFLASRLNETLSRAVDFVGAVIV
jgi:hypothetical protein